MKKLSTFALLLTLLTLAGTRPAAATIRRVTSSGATGTNVYATIDAAQNAALAKDTVQVEPGTYNAFNCTKNLRFVGTGYLLTQNPGLQAITQPAIIQGIQMQGGSSGASLTGLTITGYLYVNESNITIERCRVNTGLYLGNNGSTANIVLRQNYIDFLSFSNSGNAYIANNLIVSSLNSAGAANWSGDFVHNNVGTSGAVTAQYLDNFVVRNNIFNNNYINGTSSATFSHNIFIGNSGLTGNSNQNNVPTANLYATPNAGSEDGRYQLKPSPNPARGTGFGGADIGAFGGTNPYRPSGIPNVPSVYQFDIPISGGNINATISTRANN